MASSWSYHPPSTAGYSISRCGKCLAVKIWRAVKKYKRKNGSEIPASCPISLAKEWAAGEGWTNPRRGFWLCPTCSAAKEAEQDEHAGSSSPEAG